MVGKVGMRTLQLVKLRSFLRCLGVHSLLSDYTLNKLKDIWGKSCLVTH